MIMESIYTMPIWLRKYITFREINDYYDEEKKAYENAKKGKKGKGTTQTLVEF